MTVYRRAVWRALWILALLASCSGTSPAPTPAWFGMSRTQKLQVMKKKVLPAMEANFTAYDAERFADFSCETCHGAGADDGTYRMPNPALPALRMDKEGWDRMMKEQPVVSRFMIDKVESAMADLLEVPRYDPKTHKGFNCLRCHPRAAPP